VLAGELVTAGTAAVGVGCVPVAAGPHAAAAAITTTTTTARII
jgi:hypothetical protein